MSSDFCGAQPRPIPADKAALARGKSGRRRSIALQGFRRALPRRARNKTGGTTSVSSDSCGAQPRTLPADKAALARGKSGRRRSIALQGVRRALPRRARWDTGGTTSVSSDSCGAQPRPLSADKAALARGKNGRRRSIALQIGLSCGGLPRLRFCSLHACLPSFK